VAAQGVFPYNTAPASAGDTASGYFRVNDYTKGQCANEHS